MDKEIFWIFLINIFCCKAYQITDIQLKLYEDGFCISIPDEPGIDETSSKVIIIESVNGRYSVAMESITGTSNNGRRYHQRRLFIPRADTKSFKIELSVQYKGHKYRIQYGPKTLHDICATKNACNWDAKVADCKNEDINHLKSDTPTTILPSTTAIPPSTTTIATSTTTINDGNCQPATTIVSCRKVCKNELILEDNFDSFNTSIWQHEVRFPMDSGDWEFLLYDTKVKIENGYLKIKPILWSDYQPGNNGSNRNIDLKERCTSAYDRNKECLFMYGGPIDLPAVVVPRINTKETFNFMYGRVEIRAKFPKGDWLIPLLLLEPLTHYYGKQEYNSGQLRIGYARGNEQLEGHRKKNLNGRILYGGAVIFDYFERRDEFMVHYHHNEHWANEFHVYTLIWTNKSLELMVDGERYGIIPGGFQNINAINAMPLNAWKSGSYMAPFDRPVSYVKAYHLVGNTSVAYFQFYITLGLSVGGFGDFPDNVQSGNYVKPWQNVHPKANSQFLRSKSNWLSTWSEPELWIDYVRVYAV